MFKISKNS